MTGSTGRTGRTAPGRIDLTHPELDRPPVPDVPLPAPPPAPPPPPHRRATPAAPPARPEAGSPADDPAAEPARAQPAPRPVLARTRDELATELAALRRGGRRLALVPTMGALHAGHLALVRAAAARADAVVASIFVNPLQFGAGEDLDRYPRTPEDDLAALAAAGVALVFAPPVDEMYPGGPPAVTVDPGPLGGQLEGASRPGHFAGVLTVVTKLFGLLRPDLAVFGEKDYQQLVLVRRATADLELGIEVVGVPTVREPDGLALSSRNRHLTAADRARALSLSRALRAGAAAGPAGAGAVLAAASGELADPGLAVDYLALRGTDLGRAPETGPARLLVAARVGGTRLIDNVPLVLGRP